MQLPDEAISFNYQSLLFLPSPEDEWKPLLELQSDNFLPPAQLKAIISQIIQVKQQVATERELLEPPAHLRPLDSGFVDLPDKLLADLRKNKEKSELSRIQALGTQLRELCDRVLILGIGGSYMGARALFESLKSCISITSCRTNALGVPRFYFEGNNVDNDAFQDLLELFQTTCLSPEDKQERWASVVISKSGKTLRPPRPSASSAARRRRCTASRSCFAS